MYVLNVHVASCNFHLNHVCLFLLVSFARSVIKTTTLPTTSQDKSFVFALIINENGCAVFRLFLICFLPVSFCFYDIQEIM